MTKRPPFGLRPSDDLPHEWWCPRRNVALTPLRNTGGLVEIRCKDCDVSTVTAEDITPPEGTAA
jgi:hypothetical protein